MTTSAPTAPARGHVRLRDERRHSIEVVRTGGLTAFLPGAGVLQVPPYAPGAETEPAFAHALGLKVDPYAALPDLHK